MTIVDPRFPSKKAAPSASQVHVGAQVDDRDLEVSIVMPCLNEAEAIVGCVDEALSALSRLGLSGEVVVVDNASSDGSATMARRAGARVVLAADRGYGNACRRGLAEANGRYVVMGDADGTYDFSSLTSFVAPLQAGADIVIGNRLNTRMEAGAMPWLHRYVGNPMLTAVMNIRFGSAIGDAHCGLRSVRREFLDELTLTSPGMEFASEFIIEALSHGARIEQVPVRYRRRFGGTPKLRTFRDGWRHLRLILATPRVRSTPKMTAEHRSTHTNPEPRHVGEA